MVVILFNKLTSLHMPKSRHVLGVVFFVTISQYSKQESQESKVIHRSDILRTFIPRFILALRLSEVACDCQYHYLKSCMSVNAESIDK